ncbi:ribonuclease P protein component [Xylophilus rhododendri]|uniref:Ribonuclease P protein component n=1 Tax=Xylophilus rhododendri TaxID=2697032 RepID=A0A857JD15_9BURK|nr:ribonuclease P protein component [Xylophilus rhododendri]QHJ01528.1 ribonuclease P protein component [Xylophilus rhododendri]
MLRLKTRPQFQAVLAGGIVARTSHFALHRLVLGSAGVVAPAVDNPQDCPEGGAFVAPPLFAPADQTWVGAMVPKRWAKRAVTRNAIKRQIYTICTAAQGQLPQAAYVLRLKSTFDRKQFLSASSDVLKAAVRQELQLLLERLGKPRPA